MVLQTCGSLVPARGGLRWKFCSLCEVPRTSRYGFGKTVTAPNAWTRASTILTRKRVELQRLKRLSTSLRDATSRNGSVQLRNVPVVRALKSRDGSRQGRKSSMPDLEDEVEELPSVYKARRKDSSPAEEDSGGRGFFSWNRNTSPSEEPSRSTADAPSSGSLNNYILAGLFVMGIGAGIALDTVVNIEPSNVASREVIDRQTPNPDVCIANGMSAMVLDQRLFITFNPFNVYVSQAEVKPGCVLRQSNWRVLESRGLVNSQEVKDCKRNFNTFGFVGDLRQAPEVTCVYHSENAENQFLKDPTKAALGDGFQPKDFSEP